jgi:hypothetical protein
MAPAALQEALRVIKQWINTAGINDTCDLNTVRAALSTSLLPVPDTATISAVNAGGVSSEWVCEAGMRVTLEVWPEMFHVRQDQAPLFPEDQQAIGWVRECIGSFCSSPQRGER